MASSPHDVTEAVEDHFQLSADSHQFVGGMGKSTLASGSLAPGNLCSVGVSLKD